ncbi:MAG TPA: peptidyl-prolyl cis-trans isomerase [Sphingomicrobium sp.]
MLSSFRRFSKSKVGSWLMAGLLLASLAGFGLINTSNFGSGNIGFGMGSSTVAKVGDQEVSERELSEAMQRRLQEVRQQRPDADYATIAGDFETILTELLDQKTLLAFADKFGFHLSKRLIDAEITQIPQTKGLNGQFSQQAYQAFLAQQRLTDQQVRDILAGGLLQRLILTPVATNARVSVGMATPYASMLLESREGEGAAFPLGLFRGAFKPTEADIQNFYNANRNRYMVPEQRVLRIARIGAEQVANVTASDAEIASYYNNNKDAYAAKETRSLTQAVVQDQATANAIAAKAKAGAGLQAAAGTNVAVTSLADQKREDYASVAGAQAAAAVFSAPSGGVVGPVKTDFGWVVVKVDAVKKQAGKTLDQARAEIAAKLNVDKRKGAIEDLVDKVQSAVDGGSNFAEAAAAAKLEATTTPLITANGSSRADANYKLPPELAPALKTGFEIAPNDPPEVVTLPNEQGYAMISPAQVVPAAPAPLASVHDQVANDWIDQQALNRARQAATQVQAKVQHGTPLAQAMKESGAPLPPVQPLAARRIQLASAQGPIPAPLKMLFALGQGASRMFPDPQGRGFFIVKVDKIVPGNAMLQPALIGRTQTELQDAVSQDYAQEFLAAIRQQMKAKRNETAIQALKVRMQSSGG